MNSQRTVLRARTMGYCMGVQRAVKIVTDLLETASKPIYLLGPLIHNPYVMNQLQSRGVTLQGDPDKIPSGSVVVIRAHGMAPTQVESLKSRGIDIVDATCPRVIRSQKLVRKFSSEGRSVVLAGDADHGEIQALEGYALTPCFVVGSPSGARALSLSGPVGVVAQTTIKREEYEAICSDLKTQDGEIEVADTICSATRQRQEALKELVQLCDGIIVIGGRSSANTTRLYRTAKEHLEHVWHIESPDEIPDEAYNLNKIGLTAGASTPDEIISAVEARLTTSQ